MADFNEFNIGKQCTLVITHPLAPGGRLDLSIVTDFDAKPTYKTLKVDGLDGLVRTKHLPETWEVSFGIDRANSAVDDFCAGLDTAYFAGSGLTPGGTVTQFITEVDKSQSTYLYENVAFMISDAGSWKGDSQVKQKISGTATRRRRL
jgi:hypothetical protein